MMKKITLFLFLLTASIGYSQTVLENFEGTEPTITSTSTLVASISSDESIDTKSLKIVTEASGDAWQQAELLLQGDAIDLRTTKTATAEVYSTISFNLLAKVVSPADASGTGAGPESATSASHSGNGWETLTFDFSSPEDNTGAANDAYQKVLFLPNWNGTASGTNTQNNNWNNSIEAIYYVDNFSGVGFKVPETQVILENFEGAAPTITSTSTLVASISEDEAIDTKSLKIVTEASGDAWQQAELLLQGDAIDLRTTKTATAEVYSTIAFNLLVKVVSPADASGTGAGPESATSASHSGNGWETLSFDFSSPEDNTGAANDAYQKVLFLPNWNGTASGTNTQNNNWNNSIEATYYVDDFSGTGFVVEEDLCSNGVQDGDETGIDCGGSCAPCPAEPTDAPVTPITRNSQDVVSIYGDAYASTGLTNVPWDEGSESSEVTIADNKVLKVDFVNFLGTELTTGGVDATNMTHFHMDYWVADDFAAGQVFNPKLSNHKEGNGETSAKLYTVALGAEDSKKWLSLDIELGTDFERNNILQFLLTTSNTVKIGYLDNVYMYRAETASVSDNELLNVSMHPNPTSSRLNISAQSIIKNAAIYNVLGKQVMNLNINKNSESIDVSNLASGIYLIKYSIENATGTAKFIKE